MTRFERLLYLLGRETKRNPDYDPLPREQAWKILEDALVSAGKNPYGSVEQREDGKKYAGDVPLNPIKIVDAELVPQNKKDFMREIGKVTKRIKSMLNDVILPGDFGLASAKGHAQRDPTRVCLIDGQNPFGNDEGKGYWLLCVEVYVSKRFSEYDMDETPVP